jgi:hypothetical protein
MAPEQLTGGTVSAATDIYALATVLYEALTGHTPFSGQTPMEAALKRLQQAAIPPSTYLPSLDPRWDAALLKALEKEPFNRFRSVRDLVRALDATTQDTRAGVAILGFRNLSARPDAGWISTALADMLSRELAQAGDAIRIVAPEEVFRAQRALNLSAQDSLPRDSLEKLRDSSGSRWVVLGSYLCVGPGSSSPLKLAIRIQDTEGGKVVCNWSDRGTVGELGAMAGRAGAELRRVVLATRDPSSTAYIVSELLEPAQVGKGIAMNSALNSGARIIGPGGAQRPREGLLGAVEGPPHRGRAAGGGANRPGREEERQGRGGGGRAGWPAGQPTRRPRLQLGRKSGGGPARNGVGDGGRQRLQAAPAPRATRSTITQRWGRGEESAPPRAQPAARDTPVIAGPSTAGLRASRRAAQRTGPSQRGPGCGAVGRRRHGPGARAPRGRAVVLELPAVVPVLDGLRQRREGPRILRGALRGG